MAAAPHVDVLMGRRMPKPPLSPGSGGRFDGLLARVASFPSPDGKCGTRSFALRRNSALADDSARLYMAGVAA